MGDEQRNYEIRQYTGDPTREDTNHLVVGRILATDAKDALTRHAEGFELEGELVEDQDGERGKVALAYRLEDGSMLLAFPE